MPHPIRQPLSPSANLILRTTPANHHPHDLPLTHRLPYRSCPLCKKDPLRAECKTKEENSTGATSSSFADDNDDSSVSELRASRIEMPWYFRWLPW